MQTLNILAGNNQVLIRWILAHTSFEGNERADELTKSGAGGTDPNSLNLPTLRATCSAALRGTAKNIVSKKWQEWRDTFAASIPKLNISNLRKVTTFLTGHSTLNYTLNKYKPDKFPKTCPHCQAEEETVILFIGRCLKWSAERSALFNSFYLSTTDVVDSFSMTVIL